MKRQGKHDLETKKTNKTKPPRWFMGQRGNCNENYKIFRFTNVRVAANSWDVLKAVLKNTQVWMNWF